MLNSSLTNRSVELRYCRLVAPTTVGQSAAIALLSDLRPLVRRLTIFENIFRPTLTGTIELLDDSALSTLVPLTGIEQLHLAYSVHNPTTNTLRHYGTPESPLVFMLYAQSNRQAMNQGSETYTLSLVSIEMYASTEAQICKAYRDQKVEDIVVDVVRSAIKSDKTFVDIETTRTPMTIVFPYTSPLNAIKQLSLYGQNETHESNYLFYETLDGFHFKSIRKMIRDGEDAEIPTISQRLAGFSLTPNTPQQLYADRIELISGYDLLYLLSEGYFASTTFKVDVLSGQYEVDIRRSSDPEVQSRRRVNGLQSVPIYGDNFGEAANPTAKIFVVPTLEISAADPTMRVDTGIRDNQLATTLDGRNRELLSIQMRTVRVQVAGAPELHAGSLVNINYPTVLTNRQSGRGARDIASGRYLIVAAQHTLINTGMGKFQYETVFEAGTDSIPVSTFGTMR